MRFGLVAAVTAFSAGPAFADLTAEDVLADQLNLLGFYGNLEMEATGTKVTSQGLMVDGFRGRYVSEEDDNAVVVLYDGVELVEEADDRVRIVYPNPYSVTVVPDGEPEAKITFALDDMSHVVSGSKEALQHDIDARRIALLEFAADREDGPDELDLDLLIENIDSTLRFVEGDASSRSLRFAFDTMRLAIDGQDTTPDEPPEPGKTDFDKVKIAIDVGASSGSIGFADRDVPQHQLDARIASLSWQQDMVSTEETVVFSMQGQGVDVGYDVVLSPTALEDSFEAAIRSGQYADVRFRYERLDYDVNVVSKDQPFEIAWRNGASDMRFNLAESGLSVEASAEDGSVAIKGPLDAAFPVDNVGYTVGQSGLKLFMPVLAAEDPQPFDFAFNMEGLAIADQLWDLFDAEQLIPRDPMDLVVDLSGQMRVTVNPFEAEDGVVPFANTDATLNAFRLAVAGAVLTAEGSVRDTGTPDQPSGVGKLNAKLSGGNTLLDTLVEMGLVQADQAMGARMMLGMVARVGEGEDTLVSEIEVNEAGEIFANGQRIR